MSIPKIIHHIAPTDRQKWHCFWNQCYDSWQSKFPDYQFVLWNDSEDLDKIVRDNYPRFWSLYRTFPTHIMKIDFARLCILHKFGGIYADMDIFCYRNFESYLQKEIYFLENLTEEYTNARFENSMMASAKDHRFLEELLKYTQSCFIQFRNRFNKTTDNWRSVENDNIVNNTTGSGMISQAIQSLSSFFDVGFFECQLFNNRPMSYCEKFYTKHAHTSVWGNEYINSTQKKDRILLVNGCGYLVEPFSDEELALLEGKDYQFILNQDFDFYQDYTKGVFLREDNLEQIKRIVKSE